MTIEEKELLLKDLCARLPYGVMVDRLGTPHKVLAIEPSQLNCIMIDRGEFMPAFYSTEDVKLYLRPMDSMTEEEENEWNGLNIDPLLEAVGERHTRIEDLMIIAKSQYKPIDWLNAHHFDYRGLIEKGLTLEAPEGMYNKEK